MARIVQASNFNLDWFNEEFILWSMPIEEATEICEIIIKYECSGTSYYWYKVVEDDYKLYIGMEP